MSDEESGVWSEMSAVPPTLAGRIERLFAVTRPPQALDRPWRNSEVAAACRGAGRDMSESHLGELRRGIKTNPTMKTLEALAWFFGVRVGYFVDADVAELVEADLAQREKDLHQAIAETREAGDRERAAARELQKALRDSGVTRTAHRGERGTSAERTRMMLALAEALRGGEEDDEDADGGGGGGGGDSSR